MTSSQICHDTRRSHRESRGVAEEGKCLPFDSAWHMSSARCLPVRICDEPNGCHLCMGCIQTGSRSHRGRTASSVGNTYRPVNAGRQ